MPSNTPSNTPAAILSGLSVKPEPGLNWFHRFGPLVAVVVLLGVQLTTQLGLLPEVPALSAIEALLTLLSGGWAARLGVTPPKK